MLIRITRLQPRPGGGAAARAADAVVPQHLVVGRAAARKPVLQRVDGTGAAVGPRPSHRPAVPGVAGRLLPATARATCRCCSPRTRPTTQRLFGAPNASPYVKDGINDFVVHGDAAAVNPAQHGHQGGAALSARRSAPAQTQVVRLRLTRRGAAARGRPFADFDAVFAQRLAGGRRVLRSDHAAGGHGGRRPRQRHAPGAGRHAVDQAVLLLRPRHVARGARRRTRLPARAAQAGAQRASGSTCSTTTSSRCRTSGSTRGTPPGTWPSTCCRWRMVDPDFAKQQLDLMLRNDYLHPNGQMPAYEWNFGDVNPPVHAWATMQIYLHRQGAQRRQGRHRVPQVRLLQAAGQLHLVGQPQGPHRQQRLRGRLPRPRQHRRVRPQRAAADRRLPRAGRRHRVDGVLQPADAAHRGRAGAARPAVRGVRRRSSSSTRCGSPARWTASASTRTRCGTRRTASSTTCCACPTAARRG